MRAREFLKLIAEQEAVQNDPLTGIKAILASKIKELPPTPEAQKMLQEIEELLASVGAGGKIGLINNELAQVNDPSVTKAQKLLAKYILSLDATKEQRAELFSLWKSDKLVNRDLLLSPGKHTIGEVINGYGKNPAITELTDDLAQIAALGQGKGEFLLSVFSKGIFKMQKGDLQIDGKQIEVKTQDVGGGRFFDQEVRPAAGYSAAVENFKNTWKNEISYAFPKMPATGLKLIDLIDLVDHVEVPKKSAYYADVTAILENLFPGMDVSSIVNAMKMGSIGAAKQAYALTNLDYYRGIKKDDYGMLFIDLSVKPTSLVFFQDSSDLAAGGMRLHADTTYPVTTDFRNAYPQMRIVTTKQSADSGEKSTAKEPKKVKPAKPKKAVAPPPAPAASSTPMTPGVQNQTNTLAASKIPMGTEPTSP